MAAVARGMRSTELVVDGGPMVWHGWGDPARRQPLAPAAERFLAEAIGPLDRQLPPVALERVALAEPRLTPAQLARLAEAVGPEAVATDRPTRVDHAGGRSYPDLLRRRNGRDLAAPDAVVFPGGHDQVRALLDVCAAERIAVVPFGGGTSVVGGVEPDRGGFAAVIAADLRRMRRLLDLDAVSLIATFQPGLRGAEAEAVLRGHGLTLGHFPQSYAYATLGGYVATRSAGQASTGYGRADDLVVSLRCATPSGDLQVGRPPASAAGPDLRQLLIGSEGTLGIMTEVGLQVRPAPAVEVHEAWVAPGFAAGVDVLRALVQREVAPDIARLSDEDETRVTLAQVPGPAGQALRRWLALRGRRRGAMLILGWEGAADRVAQRRDAAARVLGHARLLRLPPPVGRGWAHSRFQAPYLRDELMDRGVLVDTLETAAPWSRLGRVHAAVRTALQESLAARGTSALVLCHVSHLYPTGASLYFTWIARQAPGAEQVQWQAAKRAASAAIVAEHATITHHHAVGTDHLPWLRDEIGDLGIEVLRAVKHRLDPTGILNPGKLIPPAERSFTES